MIHIAVVENDMSCSQQLIDYLNRYGRESGQEFDIVHFIDGYQILENYKAQFDIILMDIQMKHLDGMTTAEEIRKSDPEVIIIFITNMAQYAIRGYAVDALDYVLKPISYFAFTQRLERALSRLRRRVKKYLAIVFRGGVQKLAIDDIWYIEIQNHDLIFRTGNGEHKVTGTMKVMEEKLAGEGFFRCNKCYLVNLAHVDGMSDGNAIIKGERIQVSRSRRNEFLQTLSEYIREAVK